jgi:hypothetical protein
MTAGDWVAVALLVGGAVLVLLAVRAADARRYGRHS